MVSAENGQIALFCHGTAKKPSLVDKAYTPALAASTAYVPLTWSAVFFASTGTHELKNMVGLDWE